MICPDLAWTSFLLSCKMFEIDLHCFFVDLINIWNFMNATTNYNHSSSFARTHGRPQFKFKFEQFLFLFGDQKNFAENRPLDFLYACRKQSLTSVILNANLNRNKKNIHIINVICIFPSEIKNAMCLFHFFSGRGESKF